MRRSSLKAARESLHFKEAFEPSRFPSLRMILTHGLGCAIRLRTPSCVISKGWCLEHAIEARGPNYRDVSATHELQRDRVPRGCALAGRCQESTARSQPNGAAWPCL